MSEIEHTIVELKKLQSKDVSLVSSYTSRNTDFRKLPPSFKVSLPRFTPQRIDRNQLLVQFGSLSALSLTTEENKYILRTLEADSFFPSTPLMDEPKVTTVIDTGYTNPLHSVICHKDTEVWTCGIYSIMKLFNLQGKLVKSIKSKSGSRPMDIAKRRSWNLVYTDYYDCTVNIVENTQIQQLISLRKWKPRSICSTFSDDLLVIMDSDDDKQTKVVRYSGSIEKQCIQFDENDQPLYSSGIDKDITQNRNLDICVSEWRGNAVVVVNQAGKLRFTYTGASNATKEPFFPVGIATDSKSRILTGDWYNKCIHIQDSNGQFLRYINNCNLDTPFSLCVDSKDNFFCG